MAFLENNYLSAAMPPAFQFMGYGANVGGPQLSDSASPPPTEAQSLLLDPFNYAYHPAAPRTHLAPALQTSDSPRSSQQSWNLSDPLSSAYDVDLEERSSGRSSSVERDNLSPAQLRRKAQNRAAQRAFRERKERHVRDLEAKVTHLTTTMTSLQSDNERLKLMIQRAQSENEMLKARSFSSPARQRPTVPAESPNMLQPTFAARGTPGQIQRLQTTGMGLPPAPAFLPSVSSNDEDTLSATAVMDLLQTHPLFLSGTLDIGKVCERLRGKAQLDGMTPALSRQFVCGVIEDVGRSHSSMVYRTPALNHAMAAQ